MKAIIEDGYIIAVGQHVAGEDITDEYAAQIMNALSNVPAPEDGYGYRLKVDLTWEKYIIPPPPAPPEAVDDN